MNHPNIEVGIVSADMIHFRFDGPFNSSFSEQLFKGEGSVTVKNGHLLYIIDNHEWETEESLFTPVDYSTACFDLYDVIIGKQFHWERKENQRLKGSLRLIIENNKPTAVNVLPLEDYLLSVISSEMSATSSTEFLKAHAVISRSWLIAQKDKALKLKQTKDYQTIIKTETEYIRWFDREDHDRYDVCADDHCQRYQGINKLVSSYAQDAVQATSGEVLTYESAICDTRFSKCCGGISEVFENVWEPLRHPYLTKVIDSTQMPQGYALDLTDEKQAEQWITGNPDAFCNTTDQKILQQVLNNYDQETSDFFRWKITYIQDEVRTLLQRQGFNLGYIIDMLPVERGVSGRLVRLKIVGSEGTLTIGKELMIRKALSTSHLYSSAFVIRKGEGKPYPESFTLLGAGWGHGVGLCQIGAAVMGAKGFTYREILKHYFPGARLERVY